jgi:hypothetical protein
MVSLRPVLPSLQAIHALCDRRGEADRHVAGTRRQIAVIRSLADELHRCASGGEVAHAMREQLIAELARLGC